MNPIITGSDARKPRASSARRSGTGIDLPCVIPVMAALRIAELFAGSCICRFKAH
ncbi:hypothetical protein [Sphingomonas leidyi]|uniref:hypothetical protein n=1 Tax=Sphingomonas leidyi TaxID=68569 RepID=UPI0036D278C7